MDKNKKHEKKNHRINSPQKNKPLPTTPELKNRIKISKFSLKKTKKKNLK